MTGQGGTSKARSQPARGATRQRGGDEFPRFAGEQSYEADADLAALADHPDNPRRGDDAAVAESIEVNGWYGVVIAQRSSGRILAGHTRRRNLLASGATRGPVLWVDCDDATARRILLADNRTAELAAWDSRALSSLLSGMAAEAGGLAGSGFTTEDLAAMVAERGSSTGTLLDILDVTMADPKHETSTGDVWALGPHVLVVESVSAGWKTWTRFLTGDAVFLPHAGAFAPLAPMAAEAPLVMVQPDPYIAGHMLDMWASVNGEPMARAA